MKGQWELSEMMVNLVTIGITIMVILSIIITMTNFNLIINSNKLNREAQAIAYGLASSECMAVKNGVVFSGMLDFSKYNTIQDLTSCFDIRDRNITVNIKVVQNNQLDKTINYNGECEEKGSNKFVLPVSILYNNDIKIGTMTVRVCELT